MTVLDAQDLVRTYGARTVLGGVSLTIDEGARIGLVGVNGCGKSTLARLLAAIEPADGGTLAVRRGAHVAYLAQEPVFEGDPTAREAAMDGLASWAAARRAHDEASHALEHGQGDASAWLDAQARAAAEIDRLGGWDLEHRALAVLGHLGVRDLDRPVSTMSGGERRRVALARLLVSRPDLAILDEPTNHLDVQTIEWLESHLADEFPGALLLVTHDRFVLDRVVDRTAELERGTLHVYDGGYEAYLEAKAERQELEARAERNRQNLVRRELEWLRRTPSARTGKQKARIQRAESAMSLAKPPRERAVELATTSARSGRTLIDLEGLGIDLGGRTLIEGLDLSVVRGERIGIVGANGTGKTTLLRALLGELSPTRGRIVKSSTVKVAVLDQLRTGLDEAQSVFENVAGGASKIDVADERIDVRTYLQRFLFDFEQQKQPVSSLSGGERARVLLAKLLASPANLLVLDEPTNDLDVQTLSALETMLVEMDATCVVVTHDRWFLERVATSILSCEGDGRVVRYGGSYSTYRELREEHEARRRAELDARDKPRTATPSAAPPAASSGAKKGLSFKEARELEGMIEKIEAIDARVGELERTLGDPGVYAARGAEVPALIAELERAKEESARLMARWEELESKKA